MRVQTMPLVPRALAAGLAVALLALGIASSANDAPAVVFKTRPAADGGVISGPGPLDVTFNMCPTSDDDPGDSLKFTYDFDGDGSIDYYGHCRQTHRYPASNRCVDATVCATDRNPGHRQCRSYAVCATGADHHPAPTPTPTPSPDIRPFTYDLYSFTAKAGTSVDISVDTVSAATAFDPWACISTTPDGCAQFDENVLEWDDDDQPCTFPPLNFECPSFSATLPADGVYYLLVSDSAEEQFVGSRGLYSLHVKSDHPTGPLVRLADNVSDETLPSTRAPMATDSATPSAPPAAAMPPPAARRVRKPGDNLGAPPSAPTVVPSATPAPRPFPPAAPSGSGTAPAIVSGASAAPSRDADGRRPAPVFRTKPPADGQGRITGGASLDVTFDLCASNRADADRELSFTYDFDGDGVVDASGACRQTRRYEFDVSGPRCINSVACVGDGEKDYEACRTYAVCRGEGGSGRR